jgi:hypothetical protein
MQAMDLDTVLRAIEATAIATEIREGESSFPWIESIHVLAIVLVVGSISIVDLRLLGWASIERAVRRVTGSVLPVTWIAFAVAAVSGALLFSSNALTYGHNTWFLLKFGFLAAAGVNMLVFQFGINGSVATWDTMTTPPPSARLAGALSLLFWVAVITCGRWVGFTLQPGMGG